MAKTPPAPSNGLRSRTSKVMAIAKTASLKNRKRSKPRIRPGCEAGSGDAIGVSDTVASSEGPGEAGAGALFGRLHVLALSDAPAGRIYTSSGPGERHDGWRCGEIAPQQVGTRAAGGAAGYADPWEAITSVRRF